eukprot:4369565-Pyramimonas_sp.AAC.1
MPVSCRTRLCPSGRRRSHPRPAGATPARTEPQQVAPEQGVLEPGTAAGGARRPNTLTLLGSQGLVGDLGAMPVESQQYLRLAAGTQHRYWSSAASPGPASNDPRERGDGTADPAHD